MLNAIVQGFLYGFFMTAGSETAAKLLHKDDENGEREPHPELVSMLEETAIMNDFYQRSRKTPDVMQGFLEVSFREERLARCLVGEGLSPDYDTARTFLKTF